MAFSESTPKGLIARPLTAVAQQALKDLFSAALRGCEGLCGLLPFCIGVGHVGVAVGLLDGGGPKLGVKVGELGYGNLLSMVSKIVLKWVISYSPIFLI